MYTLFLFPSTSHSFIFLFPLIVHPPKPIITVDAPQQRRFLPANAPPPSAPQSRFFLQADALRLSTPQHRFLLAAFPHVDLLLDIRALSRQI